MTVSNSLSSLFKKEWPWDQNRYKLIMEIDTYIILLCAFSYYVRYSRKLYHIYEKFNFCKCWRVKVNELLLSLFKKSNPEQIALYHSGTVSESLSSLIKNERHEWFAHESSILLSKTSHLLKLILIFCMFLTVFHSFSPFLCPRANHTNCSLLSCFF